MIFIKDLLCYFEICHKYLNKDSALKVPGIPTEESSISQHSQTEANLLTFTWSIGWPIHTPRISGGLALNLSIIF